jgi:hypothetical protein
MTELYKATHHKTEIIHDVYDNGEESFYHIRDGVLYTAPDLTGFSIEVEIKSTHKTRYEYRKRTTIFENVEKAYSKNYPPMPVGDSKEMELWRCGDDKIIFNVTQWNDNLQFFNLIYRSPELNEDDNMDDFWVQIGTWDDGKKSSLHNFDIYYNKFAKNVKNKRK